MRVALVGLLLLVGCSKDDAKDREIAALKAQLAKQPPAPNPQPETVEKPIVEQTATPVPAKPTPTGDDPALSLVKRIDEGALSDAELKQLVLDATANKTITYAHLKKNADRYIAKPWRAYGKIVQIVERDGRSVGQLDLTGWGNEFVHFECHCETDFVDNNVVEMVGVLGGTFTYKAVNGWDMSVPSLLVAKIAKRGELDKLAGVKKRRRADDDE